MICRALPVVLLFAATAYAADFDKTLPVSGQPDLSVTDSSGRIQITPSGDGAVHVRAHLYANFNGGGDVEQRMLRIAAHPPIAQSGSSVRIGEMPAAERTLFENISIDYQIQVPRSAALTLHTSSGDIEVDNVGRSLKADTASGSVRAHNLGGPADLHCGSGDIELQETAAGDVRANTGSGSIRVSGLSGSFQATTGSGDIELSGHVTSPSRLKSGSGSVRMHLGHDARLTLNASTGSGTIRAPGGSSRDEQRVSQPINGGGPLVEVHTGSGDIEVN